MPKLVSEVVNNTQFTRSMTDGVLADSQNREFKIIMSSPQEVVDPQVVCGVKIGDKHPNNTDIICKTFSVRFDGDSRMVMLCTFSYESSAHASSSEGKPDPNNQPPDVRPANWTTSTSLIEVPAYTWRERTLIGWTAEKAAANPVGDIYDAATQLTSVVNIVIEQFEDIDPTRHSLYGGYVNEEVVNLGTLEMLPHTLMFRGVQAQPHVESWGGQIFRGWKCNYEFTYKRNRQKLFLGAAEAEIDVGWDIAVPQTGFNVIAFAPPGGADDDLFGQPLKHAQGRVVPTVMLPSGVNPGEKVRGMVKVFEYEDGGVSQLPSASPIPLNDNGRPRIHTADPKVIVRAYQVQPSINLTTTLKLRLE